MSEIVRIGLVAEGVTDYEVIFAAVSSMLGDRPFLLRLLQPEESIAFTGNGSAGSFGGGWEGVYHWSKSLRARAGKLSEDTALFVGYDLFIMHLDADVAGEDPANDRNGLYPELQSVLPCVESCPPPSATTNKLRLVMMSWLGETTLPRNAVLCTPSKSIEAWVVSICCTHDVEAKKADWECRPNPENRLAQQPKNARFSKRYVDYYNRRPVLIAGWPQIVARLSEAKRFHEEFTATVK